MIYSGRRFSSAEIEAIRIILDEKPPLSRYMLSKRVCEYLNWRQPSGKLKDMSCRVAMLKMETDGHFTLPAPRCAKVASYGLHPAIEKAANKPLNAPQVNLSNLVVALVADKHESLLWNAYMKRYHYLGYQLMAGAQLRYFIREGDAVVALLGFGASAWKIKPRDDFIGWSIEQRQRNLHFVVNNARFLILPWINCPNLASRALAMTSRRLADDWQARYAYRPVLIETFVEDQRFRGTCYKAANWRCLGKTQGRGKLDQLHNHAQPIKSI